ncbi:MAG: energy-coupling factor transporter transmembrane protein EcfT [Desulfotignum sp.]
MFLASGPVNATVIHRLHPFSKMGVGILFSILALCIENPWALAVMLGYMVLVLCTARIRLTTRQWTMIALFLTVIFVLDFLASQSSVHAATYPLRFGVFLTAMPILAATTAPQQMTRALSRTPLPAGVVMALLLVWRFFPLMAEEARQMRQAAMLRGRTGGNLPTRFYRGFLVPLAFCVIEYTDRITLALELRGFTPSARRTCHQPPRAGVRDVIFGFLAMGAAGSASFLQWGA